MKKVQTHKSYGLVTAIAVIIVGLILHVTNLSFQPWAQWVMYIPFIIGLVLNAQAFAKANDQFVTYGQVWSSCFKATAIITLIVVAWSVIFTYIFPDMIEKGMEMARQKMEERGGMSEEQMEQTLEMTKKFFYPFMIGGIVFGYIFFGAIVSLIAAAIPKKKGDALPIDMQP